MTGVFRWGGSILLRHASSSDFAYALTPLTLDRGLFARDEPATFVRPFGADWPLPDQPVSAGARVRPAPGPSLPALNVVNNAPVIDGAPIYSSDFETPGGPPWHSVAVGG